MRLYNIINKINYDVYQACATVTIAQIIVYVFENKNNEPASGRPPEHLLPVASVLSLPLEADMIPELVVKCTLNAIYKNPR